jgi:hypothetical protein
MEQVIKLMVLARLQAEDKKLDEISVEERQRYIDEAIEDFALALEVVTP